MQSRKEVLKCYRLLQRTCRSLFQKDLEALEAAKKRIKEEFWKNHSVSNQEQISQLLVQAHETEQFLRQNVVQAVYTGDNTYRVRMMKETALADNPPIPKHLLAETRKKQQ